MKTERSGVLPTDPFELALAEKMGLPNGAHTGASVTQAIDFYGNLTTYIMQTVKWEEGDMVFLTVVNSEKPMRIVLPPKVLAVIDRQRAAVVTMVRRRHGQRLAEQRKAKGHQPVFTAAMRAKALATRKAKAAKRRTRRARRAG